MRRLTVAASVRDVLKVVALRRTGAKFANSRVAIRRGTDAGFPEPEVMGSGDSEELVLQEVLGGDDKLFRVRVLPLRPGSSFAPRWVDDDTAFWPVELTLQLKEGRLTFATPPPNEVEPIPPPTSSGGKRHWVLKVWLSRVRDVTDVVQRHLGTFNEELQPPNPSTFQYSDAPLLGGTRPNRKIARTSPSATVQQTDLLRVLDLAAPRRLHASREEEQPHFRPKLVCSYYPSSVPPTKKPSFLIYYCHQLDQDGWAGWLHRTEDRASSYNNSDISQPLSQVFRQALLYEGNDPWAHITYVHWYKGLIHQVAASGKGVGIVAPVPEGTTMNNTSDPLKTAMGLAADGPSLVELLKEIGAHNARARGRYAPALDCERVGLSCFSNGIYYLGVACKSFMSSNSEVFSSVKELFVLDPPPAYQGHLAPIHQYYKSLAPDARLRVYCHYGQGRQALPFGDSPAIHTAMNTPPPLGVQEPFDDTTEGGAVPPAAKPHQTYAYLPVRAWPNPPVQGELDCHAWISATMVCHALKLSGFPAASGSGASGP